MVRSRSISLGEVFWKIKCIQSKLHTMLWHLLTKLELASESQTAKRPLTRMWCDNHRMTATTGAIYNDSQRDFAQLLVVFYTRLVWATRRGWSWQWLPPVATSKVSSTTVLMLKMHQAHFRTAPADADVWCQVCARYARDSLQLTLGADPSHFLLTPLRFQ